MENPAHVNVYRGGFTTQLVWTHAGVQWQIS